MEQALATAKTHCEGINSEAAQKFADEAGNRAAVHLRDIQQQLENAGSGVASRTRSSLDEAASAGARVFHAGTVRGADGAYRTNGGRVLAVVGLGATVATARAAAEKAAEKITWDGMQRRHDIAAKLPQAAATPPATPSPDPVSEAAWTAGDDR